MFLSDSLRKSEISPVQRSKSDYNINIPLLKENATDGKFEINNLQK